MNIKSLIPQQIKNYYHFVKAAYFANKYGNPSKKLKIIGVTGTDGKTTTSSMIYEIFKSAGKKVGLVSTLGAKISNSNYPVGFHVTTPDPRLLQKFLSEMVNAGLEYVILETTSHGLDQYRVGFIQYSTAVYTNITHEHLDYHKTFDNYRKAKMRLMSQTKKDSYAIINKDDKSVLPLAGFAVNNGLTPFLYSIKDTNFIKPSNSSNNAYDNSENTISNGLNTEIDLTLETAKQFNGLLIELNATELTEQENGYSFKVKTESEETTIKLNLPGIYNVSNALAAIATALSNGISLKDCKNGLESMQELEGRWIVLQEKPFSVIIDFAHTPNALENVLSTARKKLSQKLIKQSNIKEFEKNGRVIVVFGTAGLRDYTKRPLMGEIAGRLADITILTAEDPRTEKVNDINRQIISGLIKNTGKKENQDYYSIPDRKEAIKFALEIAKENDIIIITGKGHEKSMNFDGTGEVAWDDIVITKELLNEIRN